MRALLTALLLAAAITAGALAQSVEVSKLNAYGVVDNTSAEVSKLNAYAVLDSANATVSKLNAYAVLTPCSDAPTAAGCASKGFFRGFP